MNSVPLIILPANTASGGYPIIETHYIGNKIEFINNSLWGGEAFGSTMYLNLTAKKDNKIILSKTPIVIGIALLILNFDYDYIKIDFTAGYLAGGALEVIFSYSCNKNQIEESSAGETLNLDF